jgi:hypothetical protein
MNQPLDFVHNDLNLMMPGLGGQQMLMPPPMMNTIGGLGGSTMGGSSMGMPPMMSSVPPGMMSMGGQNPGFTPGFNPLNTMNGFNFKP